MTDTTTTHDKITAPAGHVIAWKVPTAVPLASLKQAMQAANIPANLAGDLEPRHALSRAMRDLVKQSPRLVRRLPKNDLGQPRIQLTHEFLADASATNGGTAGTEAKYEREATITLLDSGVVTVEPGDNTSAADADVLRVEADRLIGEHLAQRLTNDLTRLVQRVVDADGADLVPIREQGGAYFVPAGKDIVERLTLLLEAIGGKLNKFAVTLGHGSDESIANTLADYLIGQIAELQESVKELGPETRADVRARRITKAGEIRQRLQSYEALLGATKDRLSTELDVVDSALIKAVAESTGATMQIDWTPTPREYTPAIATVLS